MRKLTDKSISAKTSIKGGIPNADTAFFSSKLSVSNFEKG
jgi:hypothetical protein